MKLNVLLFFYMLYETDCVRRIKDGKIVTREKRYVVYLVKAPLSDKIYDEWLCGGALVSTRFIITSAACVTDVEYMYAIAGYSKYVTDDKIETDPCTSAMKKKVVYTCVPLKYELDYAKVEKWSFIDIALVKVESPYDFNDYRFVSMCSYAPTVIPVNYEQRFQAPGVDALVYGWGHLEIWRKPEDSTYYNQENLHYASTQIMDKQTCKKQYEMYPGMDVIIDQYMICALSQGEINDQGELEVLISQPKVDGCGPRKYAFRGNQLIINGELVVANNTKGINKTNGLPKCDDEDIFQDLLIDETRRGSNVSNVTANDESYNRTVLNATVRRSRKFGICQNDHGGPLVTWVGGKEILIGVASVFKVSSDSKCMGPYLYTSTQCNGAFLDCILTQSDLPDPTGRRAICDSPPILRGYDTVERHISWKNHPAGSADNERNFKAKDENESEDSSIDFEGIMKLSMLSKLAKNQSKATL